jgi:hypothetical protein
MGLLQSLSVETGRSMSLTWGHTIAGGLTLAVVAGLLLLPSRLLGADRPIELAIPAPQGSAWSVQAAPPRAIPRPHAARPKIPAASMTAVSTTPRQVTYVQPAPSARPVATVGHAGTARPRVQPHRSAVISKLVPTAPLVRARVLAAASDQRPSLETAASTAKTIAALAASLRKK